MELTPLRVPGVGAVWTLSLSGQSANDMVRGAKMASTLHKQSGAVFKDWTKRFCVLKPLLALVYFESETDTEPKGVVFLDETCSVEANPGVEAGREHTFVVRSSTANSRLLRLAADTASEARDWCEAILHNRVDYCIAEKREAEKKAERLEGEFAAVAATLRAVKEAASTRDAEAEAQNKTVAERETALRVMLQQLRALEDKVKKLSNGMRAGLNASAAPQTATSGSSSTAGAAGLLSPRPAGPAATDDLLADARSLVQSLGVAIGDAGATSDNLLTAYRGLGVKAKDVARIVQRLNAELTREREVERCKEASWADKERAWASAVQALSGRLAREKDKTKRLVEIITARASRTGSAEDLEALAALGYSSSTSSIASTPARSRRPSNGGTGSATASGSSTPTAAVTKQAAAVTAAATAPALVSTGSSSSLQSDLSRALTALELHIDDREPAAARVGAGGGGAGSSGGATASSAGPALQRARSISISHGFSSAPTADTFDPSAAAAAAAASLSASSGSVSTTTAAPRAPAPPLLTRQRSGSHDAIVRSASFISSSSTSSSSAAAPVGPSGAATTPTGTTATALLASFTAAAASATAGLNAAASAAAAAANSLPAAPKRVGGGPGGQPLPGPAPSIGLGLAGLGGPGLDSILADPNPGRLHVLVMAARNMPELAFGSFGTKSGYARVAVFGQERVGRGIECVDRGRGRGLCAIFHSVFPFRVMGSLHSPAAKLRLDIMAHRTMRSDVRAGAALLDCAPLDEWPGQPHAVWVTLNAIAPEDANRTASGKALVANPAEVLIPVQPTVTFAPTAASAAAAASAENPLSGGGSGDMPLSAGAVLLPKAGAGGGSVVAGNDPTRWASRDLPPAPVDDKPAVLLQLVYTLRPEDRPRFLIPASELPTLGEQFQQQVQQQQQQQQRSRSRASSTTGAPVPAAAAPATTTTSAPALIPAPAPATAPATATAPAAPATAAVLPAAAAPAPAAPTVPAASPPSMTPAPSPTKDAAATTASISASPTASSTSASAEDKQEKDQDTAAATDKEKEKKKHHHHHEKDKEGGDGEDAAAALHTLHKQLSVLKKAYLELREEREKDRAAWEAERERLQQELGAARGDSGHSSAEVLPAATADAATS